jgi:two-component system chemotaxis response regulator CheY
MSDSTGAKRRVLSVGQCFADHSSISRVLRTAYGAEVVAADTPQEALDRLREGDFRLVLVNRVLDSTGRPGLEVVRAIQAEEQLREVPVMLVSNYEDAQAEAVREGAVPGFGKASLGQPHMLARVEPHLR